MNYSIFIISYKLDKSIYRRSCYPLS